MTCRLLLHVGLPKTATTSLQINVLMPWWRSGCINYLGVCWAPTHLPFRNVYHRIRGARLTDGELDALRPEVDALLDGDRLNVLSDERISAETMGDGAPTDAGAVLHNLRALFRDVEVTVLVSLRSPVDLVAANYAEDYVHRLQHVPVLDTMDKYLEKLLRLDGPRAPWTAYFHDAYARLLRRYFDRVEVLLYEDLLHDPAAWSSRVAACLEAEPDEFWRLFSSMPRNVGMSARAGRSSPTLTLRDVVKNFLRRRMPFERYERGLDGYRRWLQRHPPVMRLGRRVGNVHLREPIRHRAPSDDERRRLQRLLGLRDDYLSRAFGVSAEKLVRYGYMHPDAGRPEASRTGTGSGHSLPAGSPAGGGVPPGA